MSDFQCLPTIPNLAGVITSADVDEKGSGRFTAKYVNWARIAHLLHIHAPGWLFHLRPAPDGSHIWKAPNNTGYVIGYFTDPDGTPTPDFPQSCMDNRNDPIQYEKISARDVTDTHRRCLCTTAAAVFGLAYELWAKEEVENPYREDQPGESKHQKHQAKSQQPPAAVDKAGEQEEADRFANVVLSKMAEVGVKPVGMKTLLTVLKVERLQDVPQKVRGKLIQTLTSDYAKLLNQGKNSKGEQIIQIEDPDEAVAPSIEELENQVAEVFS